jgi:hypothetical protein
MANINVSIDAKGNLVCDDITGKIGESITWVPDGTTVSSIASITATVGSFNPAPSARNNWTGTIATDGSLKGGGMGLDYTIVANEKGVGVGQKQRAPRITIVSPISVMK